MIATINIDIWASEKPFIVDFEYGSDGITDVSKIEYLINGSKINILPMYNSDELFTVQLNEELKDYLDKHFSE